MFSGMDGSLIRIGAMVEQNEIYYCDHYLRFHHHHRLQIFYDFYYVYTFYPDHAGAES